MKCLSRQILKTEQKALEINLDNTIYGTFAEIGAGQEVARNFFQVGAAVGTIAKTMSAYDKDFSNAIYGEEASKRFVCESRLYKMLDHEYSLMEERLIKRCEDTKFFVFADTVSAINYQKTIKGHGWLGLRFQLTPQSKPNDLIIHAKMKDNDNRLQQEAIGVLGVNMLYACHFYSHDLNGFVESLIDGIEGRVEVDMIRLSGPGFPELDNRLLSLYLVKHGLTEVTMFDPSGQSLHASEFLYKKDLMVVRGHYRPPTKVTLDVFKSGFEQFINEEEVEEDNARLVTEITLDYLKEGGDIDEEDFLARAKCLGALDKICIVSDCQNHENLISYLADYKIKKLGLVIGVYELKQIIEDKYNNNEDGRILVAFGELFNKNINTYVYPALQKDDTLLKAKNMRVPDGIHFLYKHLIDSKQIIEVDKYTQQNLGIFPQEIYDIINSGEEGWEIALPDVLVKLIKEKGLFGYEAKSKTV